MPEAKPPAAWSQIERREESADDDHFRDYLDDEPIHCGAGLLLQSLEWGDDGGNRRIDTGVSVRYEIDWGADGKRAVLYAEIGGHDFMLALDRGWMRFRWPPRR